MSAENTVEVKEFQPPSIQNYNARYPGYAHRFVDKNPANRRGDRLSYWLNQGWEIASYGNAGMQGNRKTGASSPDNAVHYRGLVLIRAPIALAESRNKHYREKHVRLVQASQAMNGLSKGSKEVNRQTGRKLTSAFSEAHMEKGGRVLENSSADSSKSEKALRDVDPAAIRELQEQMQELAEQNRKVMAENMRLQQEAAERKKKAFRPKTIKLSGLVVPEVRRRRPGKLSKEVAHDSRLSACKGA